MSIENTRNRDNLVHLAGILSEGQSGYIEGMESAGQAQLVNSDVLPAEALADYDSGTGDQWPRLEALGIIRGEPVAGDPLFIHATLPAGWKKEGSGHAMGSYLVDERGVRRVSIFYKAAFYDRAANISVENVGRSLANDGIYADEGTPTALPGAWAVLTDSEKAAYIASLGSYIAKSEEYPDIYADRLPRVWTLFHAAKGGAA